MEQLPKWLLLEISSFLPCKEQIILLSLTKKHYDKYYPYICEIFYAKYNDANKGLYISCLYNNNKLINYMLNKQVTDWNYAMKGACINGNIETIKLLITKGAINYNKAFGILCKNNHVKAIEYFINNINIDLDLGLQNACIKNNVDVVKIILDNNNINNKIKINCSLYLAFKYGCTDIIDLLLAHDCKCDYNLGLYGACENGSIELVEKIMGYGANDYNYGLLGACKGGNIKAIDVMIGKGANNFNDGYLVALKHNHIVKNYMFKKVYEKKYQNLKKI